MRSRTVNASLLATSVLLAFPAESRAQATAIEAVYVRAIPSMSEGQGFFVRTARGCLLLTAGHVVSTDDSVMFRTSNGTSGRGVIRFLRNDNIDLAVITPNSPDEVLCPEIPSNAQMRSVLGSSQEEFRRTSASGEVTRIIANSIQTTPEIVARPHYTDESVPRGTSGAPFISSTIVIGLLVSTNPGGPTSARGGFRVQRLFDLPDEVASWLAPPSLVRSHQKTWAPFDPDQLPEDIKRAVVRAREERKKAEAMARTAREVALRADEDATVGRSRGRNATPLGSLTFDDGTDYAGGLRSENSTTWKHGFGVTKTVNGDRAGQVIKCVHLKDKEGHCDGAAFVTFSHASAWSRWEGRTCPGLMMCGYGVLVSKDSTTMFGDYVRQGYGVRLQSYVNGRFTEQFEGELFNFSGNGLGVIWSEQGAVDYVGEWKDGKMVKSRKDELRARR